MTTHLRVASVTSDACKKNEIAPIPAKKYGLAGSSSAVAMVPFAGLVTRAVLALLSSILLVLSFPHPDQGWIAWFALVPLSLACWRSSLSVSFLSGLLSGTAAAYGIFFWLFEVPGFRFYHSILAGLYCGLFPAIWCLGIHLLCRLGVSTLIASPGLWVCLDYLKGHLGFLSLPWATLAHSQHNNLALLQLVSITGEYGLTYLIVFTNTALAIALIHQNLQRLIVPALVLITLHCWGLLVINQSSETAQLRVAAIQPNISLEERKTAPGRKASFERLERLTMSIADQHPQLIVWPETAVLNLEINLFLLERIRSLSTELGAPIVAGSTEFAKRLLQNDERSDSMVQRQKQNSAYFISSEEVLPHPYHKRLLVPFFEYNPVSDKPWLSWLNMDTHNIIAGHTYSHFLLSDSIRLSPIICWENLFADYVRQLALKQTSIIVQLTNDIHFGQTAAPYQHNIASVFRAVENRIPVVIASNGGPSQIIDSFGRVCARVPDAFAAETTMATVAVRNTESFYTKNGDIFILACVLLLALATGTAIYACSKSRLSAFSVRGGWAVRNQEED